jgi:hypothetical protein
VSPRERVIGAQPVYPDLRMMLGRQRVAELRRDARWGRPSPPQSVVEQTKRLGRSVRLPNGLWLYGRRDSS